MPYLRECVQVILGSEYDMKIKSPPTLTLPTFAGGMCGADAPLIINPLKCYLDNTVAAFIEPPLNRKLRCDEVLRLQRAQEATRRARQATRRARTPPLSKRQSAKQRAAAKAAAAAATNKNPPPNRPYRTSGNY